MQEVQREKPEREIHRCAFCGKVIDEKRPAIKGINDNVYICSDCVDICSNVFTTLKNGVKAEKEKQDGKKTAMSFPKPREIKKKLDEYIIGQDKAKKIISVAVYNHYKRVFLNIANQRKSNILLIGPTGSGKTLLAQTVSKILDVPFAIADATSLTEAGYIGDDVETILQKLLAAADGDVQKAERGIVFIDEIDKIAKKAAPSGSGKDPTGEGVQQRLLKMLEGNEMEIQKKGPQKTVKVETIKFNTKNVLFICGGAFPGLSEIIAERTNEKKMSLGFGAEIKTKEEKSESDLFLDVKPEDIIKFGMLPEFLGRLPVIAPLSALTDEELANVLTNVKGNLVEQYEEYFSVDGVSLTFTSEAIKKIAHKANSMGTGARSLQSVMEEILQTAMYEVPSMTGIDECVVCDDLTVAYASTKQQGAAAT